MQYTVIDGPTPKLIFKTGIPDPDRHAMLLSEVREALAGFEGRYVSPSDLKQTLAHLNPHFIWPFARTCLSLGQVHQVYVSSPHNIEFDSFLVVEFKLPAGHKSIVATP